MQTLRYLNLFNKVTHIQTRFCFRYNDAIFFCVPKTLVNKAIGKDSENLKKIGSILKKRVKVLPMPKDDKDIKKFLELLTNPIKFKELEISDNDLIITAGGKQTKAILLGRNKQRFLEMQTIVKDFFNKEYKIV